MWRELWIYKLLASVPVCSVTATVYSHCILPITLRKIKLYSIKFIGSLTFYYQSKKLLMGICIFRSLSILMITNKTKYRPMPIQNNARQFNHIVSCEVHQHISPISGSVLPTIWLLKLKVSHQLPMFHYQNL